MFPFGLRGTAHSPAGGPQLHPGVLKDVPNSHTGDNVYKQHLQGFMSKNNYFEAAEVCLSDDTEMEQLSEFKSQLHFSGHQTIFHTKITYVYS